MHAARILRLTLSNFRNYRAARLAIDSPVVVLTGRNGAGKTNVLEAISFLAPGRGLRRANLDEVAFDEGDGSWAVSAEIEGALGLATLGTGIEPPDSNGAPRLRQYRVDREPVSSASAFTDHLTVVWLTPAMDALFDGPASDRRRFLDRFALAVDGAHSGRVSALERSLRSRNRLLEDSRPDAHWLDAVERETAELAVAVAATRAETVRRLQAALAARASASAFPSADVRLDGLLEQQALALPAVELEKQYRGLLRDNRTRDAQAGRTLDGPHLTDLAVVYAPKQIPAAKASTGEQKALLIGLILAQAELLAQMGRCAPVVLLDEVAAHLDPGRRTALFHEIARRAGQVWMTGADPAAFAEIRSRAALLTVSAGRVEQSSPR